MLPRHRHRQNNIISNATTPAVPPPVPGRPGFVPAQRSLDEQQRVFRWVGRCQDQPVTVTPNAVAVDGSAIPQRRADSVRADWAGDPLCAQTLWEALILTRLTSPVISAAADAVFRFYLPLANILARQHGSPNVDADLSVQAAELGLANAVLAWRHPDSRAFTPFARVAITAQIRRTHDNRRLGHWTSVPPKSASHAPVPI